MSIAGVVVGDITGAAVVLTAALNRGVADSSFGEQPVAIRHDAQLEAAERVVAAGVSVEWGGNWLYHRAKHTRNRRSLPHSLTYLADALIEAWQAKQASETAQQHAAAFVPGADPSPRAEPGEPGTAVTRFTPALSAAERLAARSRENTRIALAAHAAHRGRSA